MRTLRHRLTRFVIATGVLAGAFALAHQAAHSPWFADGAELDAPARMSGFASYPEFQALKVLRGWRTYGRDGSTYLLLQGSAADVDAAKAAFLATPPEAHARLQINDDDDFKTRPFENEPGPDWWQPKQLPDPDVLAISHDGDYRNRGIWLVFSRKTGLVYAYIWTT